MRIYVTGASGYLGTALCRRLRRDDHEVRALVRAASRVEPLARAGVTLCPGDVTDRASMREGMSGADWVVHAAAVVDPRASAEAMERVNVGGSRNVASLARKLGVGRLLAVSSMARFGGSPADGSAATEESAVALPPPNAYSATKRAGEEAVREEARDELPVNTVFPSLVYGPPGKRHGANALLAALARGRFPVLVGADRRTSWVYIDDVVEAMAAVLERAAPGRDYLLAGDTATIGELAERVSRLAGRRPPRWSLPVFAARWLLALARPLYALAGRRPPLGRGALANLERHWAFDDRRARRELDWHPRDLARGLPPTVEHLLAPETA